MPLTAYPQRLEPEERHTPFEIGPMPKPFSMPQATIEDAQALHKPSILNPAAVLETPDGFVLVLLRDLADWPPHKAAKGILDATGFRMVACCDPVLSVWQPYTEDPGPPYACIGSVRISNPTKETHHGSQTRTAIQGPRPAAH